MQYSYTLNEWNYDLNKKKAPVLRNRPPHCYHPIINHLFVLLPLAGFLEGVPGEHLDTEWVENLSCEISPNPEQGGCSGWPIDFWMIYRTLYSGKKYNKNTTLTSTRISEYQ